jgi:hypothetical protein
MPERELEHGDEHQVTPLESPSRCPTRVIGNVTEQIAR